MNTTNTSQSATPSATPGEQEPSSTRLVASMAIAGFISGVIIIAIYMLTFDTIKENKARELREAVFKVLPGVTHMQKLHYVNNKLVVVKTDGIDDEMIFSGYDKDGKFVGYAMQGKAPGFQDTVHILFGYLKSNGNVTGMQVLESRETPGLGDKIFKDMDFVNEFVNLPLAREIVAVKKGTKTQDNQIDAITGATISSKIVVKIINVAYKKWSPRLPEQGSEPELQQEKKTTTEDSNKQAGEQAMQTGNG